MILDELPVDPHMRYNIAQHYYKIITTVTLMHDVPEIMRMSDLGRDVEMHMLQYGTMPDVNAYCQAVVEALQIYLTMKGEYYWKDDLDGLAGITIL